MSQIFISHSSADNAQAIALRDWLVSEGWSDLFLDLDPDRGIAAGERWERALNDAARRCEAVLFLVSKAWLGSRWCMNELTLARRLNKRLFGVLVEEGLTFADLPNDVTATWQLVNLAAGRDHQQFRITLPITGEEAHVTYSLEGLRRLKSGLWRAGLHASYFEWPPEHDPKRAPYRGLRPLEADDAGIFFGREAPVIEAIDSLRGLTEAAPPRLMVIIGASGGGKSSFLRAGVLPRLERDSQNFLPLPVIRPERSAISGESGLLNCLVRAFEATSQKLPRGDIRQAIAGGAATLKPLLTRLLSVTAFAPVDGCPPPKPPTLVLAIDQGEELFLAEAREEAQAFLELLRDLLLSDSPSVIGVFTIRSDNFERLQTANELEGIHQQILNLPPMPKGAYAEVVKGPVRRLQGTTRELKVDDALVDALLADIEAGGAKDALPLLAFTLERLYEEYGATGHLTLNHYVRLGRIKGSIEAAVERAFEAADKDQGIPRDRSARLALLRRGLIPWLAGIDPDTRAPRRRVARLSEIPGEARPLVDLLVEQRLLSTDRAKDTGEITIEPAHEALLRNWGLLEGWLADDAGLLTILEGVKRASRDWAANGCRPNWLTHSGERLQDAERLLFRKDIGSILEKTDTDYLLACSMNVPSGLVAFGITRDSRRAPVFIGLPTAPGRVAYDGNPHTTYSPFALALDRHLNVEGLEVKELYSRVVKDVSYQVESETGNIQYPWSETTLNDNSYLNPKTTWPIFVMGLLGGLSGFGICTAIFDSNGLVAISDRPWIWLAGLMFGIVASSGTLIWGSRRPFDALLALVGPGLGFAFALSLMKIIPETTSWNVSVRPGASADVASQIFHIVVLVGGGLCLLVMAMHWLNNPTDRPRRALQWLSSILTVALPVIVVGVLLPLETYLSLTNPLLTALVLFTVIGAMIYALSIALACRTQGGLFGQYGPVTGAISVGSLTAALFVVYASISSKFEMSQSESLPFLIGLGSFWHLLLGALWGYYFSAYTPDYNRNFFFQKNLPLAHKE